MVVVKSKRETHEAMGNSHINSAGHFDSISINGRIHFVKTTLNETSIALLEEKISKSYDPYMTPSSPILLEEGSLVKREELQRFYLFTAEKIALKIS